jgi:hypothetical protein
MFTCPSWCYPACEPWSASAVPPRAIRVQDHRDQRFPIYRLCRPGPPPPAERHLSEH